MPEVLNIPVMEQTSHYKFSNTTRVAIVVCLLLAALLSTFTVRYLFTVTTLPSSTQLQTIERRELRVPSDYERLDALRSKVAELQRTVDAISRKNPPSKSRPLVQHLQSNNKIGWLPIARAYVTQKHLKELAPGTKSEQRHLFEKEKRMVSWQPVKRDSLLRTVEETNDEKITAIYDALTRERVMSIIEQQLNAILYAGERLGITPGSVLKHLRTQNGGE